MSLKVFLAKERPAVLKRWFDAILETYPSDTASFLKSQKDQFANPVGHSISEGLGELYDMLLEGLEHEKAAESLDKIIRIRALQGFAPSQAVGFVFVLKYAVRASLEARAEDLDINDLLEFEAGLDDLALIAFDVFMKCREKLYEIKADETRNRHMRLLEKAGLLPKDDGGLVCGQ